MHKSMTIVAAVAAVLICTSGVQADMFGTGGNQFAIDFVPISGATNPASGYGIVNNDYRMGTFEITNDQWDNFKAEYGPVTGSPANAYDSDTYSTGTNVPTNRVSWYEAAQFVNYLNTSKGHQAAYKFTGTQGHGEYAPDPYTLDIWSEALSDNGNRYRHKDAFYFMPTEHEWVKAAYWNGTSLQTYATKPGDTLHQGDGVSGTGWNYYDNGYPTDPAGPWDVGSGSEELNGTFDMMGNVWEWMESPYSDPGYGGSSTRGLRGGSFLIFLPSDSLASSGRHYHDPYIEGGIVGFRVASEVPEPSSLALLSLGALALLKRRRET